MSLVRRADAAWTLNCGTRVFLFAVLVFPFPSYPLVLCLAEPCPRVIVVRSVFPFLLLISVRLCVQYKKVRLLRVVAYSRQVRHVVSPLKGVKLSRGMDYGCESRWSDTDNRLTQY